MPQQTLHAAINRYLSTISAVGECLATACPPVGGPYRHQFTRLRTRLAFDPSPESLDESFRLLADGMKQYAGQANGHLERHRSELSGALESLLEISTTIARRQDFFHSRLRRLVEQIEKGTEAASVEELRAHTTAQARALEASLESFSHESHSLLTRIFDEIAAVEKRVAESATTDPVTNLTNRREMERQIEARRSAGAGLVLLRYSLAQPVPDEVAREMAIRMTAQFRPHDIISRWSATEFLVIFQGPVEIAEYRVHQVTPWIGGRYPLDGGGAIDIQVQGEIFENVPATTETQEVEVPVEA